MKKPQLLRQHLVAALPCLQADPERLLIFVDNGGVAGTYRPGASFEYRYTLDLVLTDFAGAPEAVTVPLLQWLTRHQSELLANPANRDKLTFEVDVLSDNPVDLAIKLPLTERVRVVAIVMPCRIQAKAKLGAVPTRAQGGTTGKPPTRLLWPVPPPATIAPASGSLMPATARTA